MVIFNLIYFTAGFIAPKAHAQVCNDAGLLKLISLILDMNLKI